MADYKGDKTFVHDRIIEIMNGSGPENPMRKINVIRILEDVYHIHVSRTCFDEKLADLEKKGYYVHKTGKGFYLENTNLMFDEGELRYLIDSLLYSGSVPASYASEMIEKLAALGTPQFAKQMKKRSVLAKLTGRSGDRSLFLNIDYIQEAINENRQISCNVTEYDMELAPVKKYDRDIVVNPYELAFSGGKYYLVCSVDGSEEVTVLRVDRLTDVKLHDTKIRESAQFKKIKNDKGMQKYISSQPELKGGRREHFTLLCYREALSDVYDAFGDDLTVKTYAEENYDDPDTVRVSVETTHDAMVSWAVMHAGNVVVTSPKSVREEIVQALKAAEHTYFKTGKPAFIRAISALNIEEALREVRISGRRYLRYSGHGKKNDPEKVDLSKADLSGIRTVNLWACDVSVSDINTVFENVEKLQFVRCSFTPDIFDHFPNLKSIGIVGSDIADLGFLKRYGSLRELRMIECGNITDFSEICGLDGLRIFETDSTVFTEAEAAKLSKRFPDCKLKLAKPRRKK